MLSIFGSVLLAACGIAAAAAWYMLWVPGKRYQGPLPAMTAEERTLAESLRRHVTAVASLPHNTYHYDALLGAAGHIEAELARAGYAIVRQEYVADGKRVWNIEATVEPKLLERPLPSIVIGAHYDSAGDAPGANDNGSAVAALLEIARALGPTWSPRRKIRLVFFVNEEPPYFRTDLMGSRRYARMLVDRGEPVRGMIALEMLGSFSDAAGSQKYPPPFHHFFPSVGNFIAFVAMPGSRAWLHAAMNSFRSHTHFPTIGGVAPGSIPGIDWSDHASFARLDMPALMVTDTALFRYPHYHLPSDTPDKIDYDRLARITKGLERTIQDLTK